MDAELVYVGCNAEVAAIDLATGREVWRTDLTDTAGMTAEEDVAVLHHGAVVLAGCHGHLFCLDAKTGKLNWHNGLEGMGWNDVSVSIDGKVAQVTRVDATEIVEDAE